MNSKRISLEVVVGLFMLVGLAAFAYLAVQLAGKELMGSDSYTITARFSSISGLSEGAPVELAGVNIGKVLAVYLDKDEYEAVVEMSIGNDVELQEDSIASIRSTSLIGEKIVSITAGGAELMLAPGDEIIETEPSVSLEELISKYIFEGTSE